MAMNGAVLGALIQTKVDVAVAASLVAGPAQRQAIFKAIGEAIVEHIQGSAVVAVPSVSGVTPGIGVSGPGVGTIT